MINSTHLLSLLISLVKIPSIHFLAKKPPKKSQIVCFRLLYLSVENTWMHILFVKSFQRWNLSELYGVMWQTQKSIIPLHSSPNHELRAFNTDSVHYVERLYLMWPNDTVLHVSSCYSSIYNISHKDLVVKSEWLCVML